MRVTVPDGETPAEGAAWLVAVGNGRSYAGGMKIAPDARADDGLLDVCVVGPVPTATFLANFPKVFNGTHVAIPGVETFRGGPSSSSRSAPASRWTSTPTASASARSPPASSVTPPRSVSSYPQLTPPRSGDVDRALHAGVAVAGDVAEERVVARREADLGRRGLAAVDARA